MSTKAEKEKQKLIQEKCMSLLVQMLKDDDNKYCVDCDAKGPRWASWNIGIFLCIRCAGIHRHLGVHISRVKSVNLDTWTPEQVVSLQQMGNSRARAVYEANLPDNFRRPQSDSSLEAFIRAKYEQKKYIAKEWCPPAIPKVNWDKEFEEEAEKARRKKKDGSKLNSAPVPVRTPISSVPVPAPLPKPISSSPKSSRNKLSLSNGSSPKSASADLLGLDMPSFPDVPQPGLINTSLNQDIKSIMTSTASESSHVSTKSAEEDSFFNQPVSQPTTKHQLTTDSIMALYGKSQPIIPNQVMFPTQPVSQNMKPFPAQQYNMSGFVNSTPVSSQPGAVPNNNQFMANPFFNMDQSQRQPMANPQFQQFSNQMANLSLGNTPLQQHIPPQHPPMSGSLMFGAMQGQAFHQASNNPF